MTYNDTSILYYFTIYNIIYNITILQTLEIRRFIDCNVFIFSFHIVKYLARLSGVQNYMFFWPRNCIGSLIFQYLNPASYWSDILKSNFVAFLHLMIYFFFLIVNLTDVQQVVPTVQLSRGKINADKENNS